MPEWRPDEEEEEEADSEVFVFLRTVAYWFDDLENAEEMGIDPVETYVNSIAQEACDKHDTLQLVHQDKGIHLLVSSEEVVGVKHHYCHSG